MGIVWAAPNSTTSVVIYINTQKSAVPTALSLMMQTHTNALFNIIKLCKYAQYMVYTTVPLYFVVYKWL